jgi:hypothetical protein
MDYGVVTPVPVIHKLSVVELISSEGEGNFTNAHDVIVMFLFLVI